VAVPVPVRRLFTYAVRPDQAGRIRRGSRVRVPFGGRHVVATVVDWPVPPPEAEIDLKPIESVLDSGAGLSEDLLGLTRFVSDYYLCSWGEAIEAALPADPGRGRPARAVRLATGAQARETPVRGAARRRLIEQLGRAEGRTIPLRSLDAARRRLIRPLAELGLVELVEEAEPGRPVAAAAPPALALPPTPGQREVLARLAPTSSRRSASRRCSCRPCAGGFPRASRCCTAGSGGASVSAPGARYATGACDSCSARGRRSSLLSVIRG